MVRCLYKRNYLLNAPDHRKRKKKKVFYVNFLPVGAVSALTPRLCEHPAAESSLDSFTSSFQCLYLSILISEDLAGSVKTPSRDKMLAEVVWHLSHLSEGEKAGICLLVASFILPLYSLMFLASQQSSSMTLM